ncbi:MAG: homoserine dehydrogenase [Candidatus Omnitrophica bacterium]|nr:homoserine dehydrogenase [Candidatus Omnitrophota bacterium]
MKQTESSKTIGIGLLGLGTVGTGVVKILKSQGRAIEKKTGIRLALRRVCVKSLSKKRGVALDRRLLTTDPSDLIRDPSIDILVELIGGIHPAKEIIHRAFLNGKHVVTANKALLAEEGGSIFREAARLGRKLGIEASVCGGIPIIQSIREGLASNSISQFLGIVNGTCNFILSAMSQGNLEFREALRAAERSGYAEKNPRLDIEGVDSAHKLAILARLAFRTEVPLKAIFVEGISKLSKVDIQYASELGYVIKLLAIAKRHGRAVELRVHPTMLPLDHVLAGVRGVYNAVFLHADQAGDLLFYGKGAGEMPTASAVVSDIIDIAKRATGQADLKVRKSSPPDALPVRPMDEVVSNYYLRFQVEDKPGVLGRIAQTLGKNHISILSVHQKESHDSRSVPVIILTYEASEKNLRRALRAIDSKGGVRQKTVVLRVEK